MAETLPAAQFSFFRTRNSAAHQHMLWLESILPDCSSGAELGIMPGMFTVFLSGESVFGGIWRSMLVARVMTPLRVSGMV